jgi:hypothetical protein
MAFIVAVYQLSENWWDSGRTHEALRKGATSVRALGLLLHVASWNAQNMSFRVTAMKGFCRPVSNI